MKRSKRKSLIIRKSTNAHAKQRALERYGIVLNSKQRYEILKKIQTNQAEFLERQSNSRSVFIVELNNVKLKIVYDGNRKLLRTVLPIE
jgi:hypothetical protein